MTGRITRLLVRSRGRHELVQLGGAGGWWVPRWAVEPPGVAYSAGAGDDLSFELALHERGYRVVVFDPAPAAAASLQQAGVSSDRFELVSGRGLFDEQGPRWVNIVRLRVGPGEHRLLDRLLEEGPWPGTLCVEFSPPGSVSSTAGTVMRWWRAGFSVARIEGSRFTFVPRSTIREALARRRQGLVRHVRRQQPPARIVQGNSAASRPVLALTFDDGPSEWTPPILDALRAAGARATFFVVGESIPDREPILRRMRDEGHELGNHTFSHPDLSRLDRTRIRSELARTNDAIAGVLGTTPRLFRPPYLADSDAVREIAGAEGLELSVHAPVWTRDWAQTAAEIVEAILAAAYPGAIVLLHDGCAPHDPEEPGSGSPSDRLPTVEAVSLLLPALLERGYELVTVSELLAL